MTGLQVFGLTTIPEVKPGDDLAVLIAEACAKEKADLQSGDVVVVTQKVVSKAEGRLVDLETVKPSPFAEDLASRWEKDPRHLEVILRETRRIVRMESGVLIVETHLGFVCANAGVDRSNVPGDDTVSLLPVDPDASAARIRSGLIQRTGAAVAVIISDTFGRPWREGATEVAIGLAGMEPLQDYRGRYDPYGKLLRTTEVAMADQLAGAVGLVLEKLSRMPVGIVRGFPFQPGDGKARSLIRPAEKDLFR